jgi:two-component system sensor histidine kinase BarA
LVKAFNGETAIQLAKEKHFDLILMDINLGTGIDGVEAMLQIRKINGNASMPFIAVTGFSSMEDKKRLLSLGFNAFLPKPFTRQSLLSVVQESLK